MRKSSEPRQSTRRAQGPEDTAEASWLAVKLSSPPLLCMTSLIQSCLGMHCVCARAPAFHLACQPTAASSPLPLGLVGVNEQQALSNCLCLTPTHRAAEKRKRMERRQATLRTTPSDTLHLLVRADKIPVWRGPLYFFTMCRVMQCGGLLTSWLPLRVDGSYSQMKNRTITFG